jgi:hypothetical protein
MSKLITVQPWSRISNAVRQTPNNCFIAVAYFSDATRLPLKRGSTLVVDMSKSSVRGGRTNPNELLKLVNRGVDVYSVGNLHAKVFAIGRRVFVGSTNVSETSATGGLVEAVVESTDPNLLASAKRFVKSLRGTLVTPHMARSMAKIYKPVDFGRARGKHTGDQRSSDPHPPLWVVSLVREDWDAHAKEQEKVGMPKARKRLRSSRYFRVEDFHWTGRRFIDRVDRGHSVIQIIEEGNRRRMVYPTNRVIHVQRYVVGGVRNAIVFLESSRRQRARNVKRVIERIGPAARILKNAQASQVRDRALADALRSLGLPSAYRAV